MILFMGVAGAGKSVQGRYLSDMLGYPWISTGEILRQHISGEKRQRMLKGELLTDDELYEIVEPVLKEHVVDGQAKVILDGFPRTHAQAEWLQSFAETNNVKITCIIRLEADQEVVVERLLARGRPDDTEEVLKTRFTEYEKSTKPILDFFEKQGIPSPIINGNGTEEEVRARIVAVIDKVIVRQ
jgi:adenylate kinase